MLKRVITGVVLAALASWSAPLVFAVHADAARAGQESSKAAQHHSCCPRFHSPFIVPEVLPQPLPQMPCGDQHPCCARQAPENSSVLPASSRPPLLDPDQSSNIVRQSLNSMNGVAAECRAEFIPSYLALNTVLRI